VEIAIFLSNGSKANVKPIGDWFTAATNIAVKYVEVAVDDINTRMMVDVLSGKGSFDIALPASFGIPDLVESRALRKLDDFAAKYAPTTYTDSSLYSVGDYYKGKLYGYQTDGDTYLMFYQKQWLSDADERKRFADLHGYPLAVPQTWQQLDAMMAFFNRPDDKRYAGALLRVANYIAWEWWVRFHAKGYWPFDSEIEPQIDIDAGVHALEELIAASKNLYPQARTNGLFENWEAFSKGDIFCNIGWGGTQKYLNGPKSAVRGKLAFGPTPGGEVDGKLLHTPYFNWGWNYTIPSGSKEAEIAYLFTLCACSSTLSTLAVREDGFFDPFRKEHYGDPQIIKTYSKEFLQAHQNSMQHSIPDMYLKGQGDYFDTLRENILQADRGTLGAQQALQKTAKQWRRTTRRMGRNSQIEQWAFLRSKYPPNAISQLR
jgi:multiple sugar transport system substrate-binding protein